MASTQERPWQDTRPPTAKVAMCGLLQSVLQAGLVTEGAKSKCRAFSSCQKETLWTSGTLLGEEADLQVLLPSSLSGVLLTSVVYPAVLP